MQPNNDFQFTFKLNPFLQNIIWRQKYIITTFDICVVQKHQLRTLQFGKSTIRRNGFKTTHKTTSLKSENVHLHRIYAKYNKSITSKHIKRQKNPHKEKKIKVLLLQKPTILLKKNTVIVLIHYTHIPMKISEGSRV